MDVLPKSSTLRHTVTLEEDIAGIPAGTRVFIDVVGGNLVVTPVDGGDSLVFERVVLTDIGGFGKAHDPNKPVGSTLAWQDDHRRNMGTTPKKTVMIGIIAEEWNGLSPGTRVTLECVDSDTTVKTMSGESFLVKDTSPLTFGIRGREDEPKLHSTYIVHQSNVEEENK